MRFVFKYSGQRVAVSGDLQSDRTGRNRKGMAKRSKELHPFKDWKKKVATLASKQALFKNDYDKYYPDKDTIDIVNLSEITPEDFFKNYVLQRKPVIIEGVIPDIDISEFQPEKIVQTLQSEDLLLVEKRFKGGFGSGTERIKMSFEEFMHKVQGHDGDQYYLTTQYTEDDPDTIRDTMHGFGEDDDDDDDDEEDDDDDDDEDEGDSADANVPALNIRQLGADNEMSDNSDADSIDMNNLHDDFEDSDGEPENADDDQLLDGEIAVTDVVGGPLSVDEAEKRVQELVQKPLTNLIKSSSLPLQPELLNKLVLQQVNLWIGSANPTDDELFKIKHTEEDYGLGRRVFGGGVSSGLHHDHADNLYIPIKGSKRFTIFAPMDAEKMYTVGQVKHVHDSGVIDYENNDNAPGWRELRSDSAIVTEVAKWRLDNDDSLSGEGRDELIATIEKEENVLNGFERKVIGLDGVKKDPPSFSKVPASIVQIDKINDSELRSKLLEFAELNWPNFFRAQRMTGHVKPGQMLYLPTGWFHEVTSFGENVKSKTHIALNYWYSPPNDKEKVYQDKYWQEDFERTLKSCEYFRSS